MQAEQEKELAEAKQTKADRDKLKYKRERDRLRHEVTAMRSQQGLGPDTSDDEGLGNQDLSQGAQFLEGHYDSPPDPADHPEDLPPSDYGFHDGL